jgi:hypothetical protein
VTAFIKPFRFLTLRVAFLSLFTALAGTAEVREVGDSQRYSTVCEAIQEAQPGDLIVLAAKTFSGSCTWRTSGLTVRGQSGGTVIQTEAEGPTWQIIADETVIEGITFLGSAAEQRQGLAVEQLGGKLTLRDVRISGVHTGVLANGADGSTLTIERAQMFGNFRNVWAGRVDQLNVIDSHLGDTKGGDSIDTSAVQNLIQNSRLTSKPRDAASRELVIRDSQVSRIVANVFERREVNSDGVSVQYISTGPAGTLDVTRNTFLTDNTGTLFIEAAGDAVPATNIDKNIIWGGLIDQKLGSDFAARNFFGSTPGFTESGEAVLPTQAPPSDWGAPEALVAGRVASPDEGSEASPKMRLNAAVTAPGVRLVVLTPAQVVGGVVSRGIVYLTAASPSGTSIQLKSSNTSVAYFGVPTAYVAPGATTGSFTVFTRSASQNVTITATANGASESAVLTVSNAAISRVWLEDTTVGGDAVMYASRVYLTGPAPAGGMVVSLSTSNGYASVPSTILVPGGVNSHVFTIHTKTSASPQTVTITARNATGQASSSLTILPLSVEKVTSGLEEVTGGGIFSIKAWLNGPAPSTGLPVTLRCSDSTVATMPSTTTAASGNWYAGAVVFTKKVSSSRKIWLSATAGGVTKYVVVTVKP